MATVLTDFNLAGKLRQAENHNGGGTLVRSGAAVAVLAALMILPWIWQAPFATRGEPREALTPQAILRTGEWILPRRYGEEIPTKPPLFHWLIAAVSLPSGAVSEGTARLPSALGGIATVAVLFFWIARRRGAAQGAAAAVVLLGSVLWYQAAMRCRIDMTLAAFMSLGLFALFNWEERGLRGIPWAAVFFITGAALAKGPVGLILPCAIMFLYLARLRRSWKENLAAQGRLILPVALLTAFWYGAAYLEGGGQFLRVFYEENFARFTGSMDTVGEQPHAHSVWYLYGLGAAGLMPWSLVPLVHAACAAAGPRPRWSLSALCAWGARLPQQSLFAALAAAGVLGFFSIPASKRVEYLLPAFPFAAVLLAEYLMHLSRAAPRVLRIAAGLICLLAAAAYAAALAAAGGWIDPVFFARDAKRAEDLLFYRATFQGFLRGLSAPGAALLGLPFVAAVAGLVFWIRGGSLKRLAGAALGAYFGVLLVLNGALLPEFARALTPARFAREAAPLIQDAPLYSFPGPLYGLNFYLEGRLSVFEPAVCRGGKVFVFAAEQDLPRLAAAAGAGCRVRALLRSGPIEKPRGRLVLAEVAAAP